MCASIDYNANENYSQIDLSLWRRHQRAVGHGKHGIQRNSALETNRLEPMRLCPILAPREKALSANTVGCLRTRRIRAGQEGRPLASAARKEDSSLPKAQGFRSH